MIHIHRYNGLGQEFYEYWSPVIPRVGEFISIMEERDRQIYEVREINYRVDDRQNTFVRVEVLPVHK